MSYRHKLVSAAVLAGAALLPLAWVAQAQQEPHGETIRPVRLRTRRVPTCRRASRQVAPGVLFWPDPMDTADPMVIHVVPRTAPLLGVLLILALHLSALIVWAVAALIRRAGSRSDATAPSVRPVPGVAIIAPEVMDGARARALQRRRDHARLVSVPPVRPGLDPLSPGPPGVSRR